MVDPAAIARTREALGSKTRRILVTGGTGFVGSHLAETLARAGHTVLAMGRNPYLAPRAGHFIKADLRNARDVSNLCRDVDTVIHCAADTSPWKRQEELHDINVTGTQNLIDGCQLHHVRRFVHVSSTSIMFDGHDHDQLSESAPLPARFACGYAATKYLAEQRVDEACKNGLNAITLRARAIFGPGDNCLLPRLLRAYDTNTLRQIGDGTNVTDLTYIDNLVYALTLAIDRGDSGTVCTITNHDPVRLWDVLHRILAETGRTRRLGTVPIWVANAFAAMLEVWYRTMNQRDEPPLTRYSVGLLARSQTFSTATAEAELGYTPPVSVEEGIRTTIKSLKRKSELAATNRVNVSFHTTGYTEHSLRVAERKIATPKIKVRFHAMIAVLTHSEHGVTLFDTGYAPRFHQATSRWPLKIYAWLTPVVTNRENTAKAIVQKLGIAPEDVRRIIQSHFHADHICGLQDFPNAEIVTTRAAWLAVRGRVGWSALKRAYLPAAMPSDVEDRLCLIENFHDPGIGPFAHCHDLFRDGSVRLVPLPGHAAGQFGALLQCDTEGSKVLVADAVWTGRTIREQLGPTWAFRLIADSASDVMATINNLVDFHRDYPDVELVPTHCPDVARKYRLDDSFPTEPG